MAQNEKMTRVRRRALSGFSGGGSFFFATADIAFAGTSSSFNLLVFGSPLTDEGIASSRRGIAMKLWHGRVVCRNACRKVQMLRLRPEMAAMGMLFLSWNGAALQVKSAIYPFHEADYLIHEAPN